MSGHSHFSTIKHKKAASDAKKSKIFSKLSRLLSMAAREKGSSPDTNQKLKLAIDQAKKANMPSENIQRAIKKGTGDQIGENLEEVSFEAYGPGGIAVIIEGITDNKNRTLAEIKKILLDNGGKLAGERSVKWMFERKGIIIAEFDSAVKEKNNKEETELLAIESGADDVVWQDETLEIKTKPEELEEVKKNLEDKGISIASVFLGWSAKEEISMDKEKESCQKLFESLDDNDSVQGVYSNLK
ncbi:MAG: YebC/PmpR family DNA-binding transcriptional regulator [Candidatus Nealsonbacteria bacterium]